MIFVFGSNEAGIHGKGAALWAKKYHGAKGGQGEGRQGKSYAIPTKSTPYTRLTLSRIEWYVNRFIEYVKSNPDKMFCITAIGTGLAGYNHEDIAPMFDPIKDFPNCIFPVEWKLILEEEDE